MAESPESPESTVQLLLAEHERVSSLYQHNADMGDRYLTTYFTILSVMAAITIGLGQTGASLDVLVPIDAILLALVFVIGLFTFVRLVERRIRAVEYLRAINRIHHFFFELDPKLANYLYWRPYDNFPDIDLKGTTLGGLRDIIAVCNSLVLGFLGAIAVRSYAADLTFGWITLIGLAVAALCWGGQYFYKERKLEQARAHLSRKVRFPQ